MPALPGIHSCVRAGGGILAATAAAWKPRKTPRQAAPPFAPAAACRNGGDRGRSGRGRYTPSIFFSMTR